MKLDIIIPFYNTRPIYFEECLKSIFSQTFKDFRIILINDGSYKYNYSNIVNNEKILYLKNSINLGVCRSVNKAFKYVTSEYCIRIDSDDYINNHLLEREIEFLDNNPEYIAVCCEINKFQDTIRDNIIHVKRPDNWNLEDVKNKKYHGYGYAGGMMFRSSALVYTSINNKMPICEDFDFHVQLLKLGKIHSIHESLYYYRKHSNQITNKYRRAQREKFLQSVVESVK